MTTFLEIKKALAARTSDIAPRVRMDRSMIFFEPVGYYLRGCLIQISKWGPETFAVHEGVVPLFGSARGYGRSDHLRTAAGSSGWNIADCDEFAVALRDQLAPSLGSIQNGGQYRHYLETRVKPIYGVFPPIDVGLAELHSKNLRAAKEHLNIFVDAMSRVALHAAPVPDLAIIKHLVRLIDEDPESIPAYCEAVARKALAARKLEKYWSAGPFWP